MHARGWAYVCVCMCVGGCVWEAGPKHMQSNIALLSPYLKGKKISISGVSNCPLCLPLPLAPLPLFYPICIYTCTQPFAKRQRRKKKLKEEKRLALFFL